MRTCSKLLLPILPFALQGCEEKLRLFWFFPLLGALFVSLALLVHLGIRRKVREAQHLAELTQSKRDSDEAKQIVSAMDERQKLAALYWHHMIEELRTPLHGLQGFLHLAVSGHYGQVSPAVSQVMQTSLQLSQILRQDLEAIAVLTQSKENWLTIRAQTYELERLLGDLDPFLELLKQRHSEIRFRLKKLWTVDQSKIVQDIPKLSLILRQILQHTFSQARNRTTPMITLAFQYRNRLLTIEISLEGAPLRESHPSTESSPLTPHVPLVLAFLKWLGGELREMSDPELGYRWTLLLPDRAQADLLQTPLEPSEADILPELKESMSSLPQQTFHLDWSGESPHILIVDDHPLNCELIREILLPHGYRVSLAFGGKEGLQKMFDLRPNLVLLDLMMPDYTGEDVLKEKQEQAAIADIPVILVTARASDQDRLFGLDLGADDFLAKPIAPEELLLRVKNLLQRIRLTRQITLMENREEHALMGELLQGTGKAILKIFSQQKTWQEQLLTSCDKLRLWSDEVRPLASFVHATLAEQWQEEPSPLSSFPLPDPIREEPGLRDLRRDLLSAALPLEEKVQLWSEVLTKPQAWTSSFRHTFQAQKELLQTARHLEHAQSLLVNLMSSDTLAEDQHTAALDNIAELALALFRPRMEELAIRFNPGEPAGLPDLMISPRRILLLQLHILSYVCDQLAQYHKDDKWLSLRWEISPDEARLCIEHGGPLLNPEEGAELLQKTSSPVGKDSLRIHGLYEAKRLAQLCEGKLTLGLSEVPRRLTLCLPVRKV